MKALSDLVALGEGSTLEFKRSLRSDLGREICAFANAAGGVILLGVDDDGAVRGVEGHNRLKSQVQSVARSADPSIGVEIESMGNVLAVRVPAQRGKPYSFGGKFFIRNGASSQQMSRDEIRDFFFVVGAIRFDQSPCRLFSLESDLDDDAVAHRDYRSTANVQVCLYHDRLEVVSPGGLPAGMTEAELGVKSVPRNPLLFGMLHRMDAVEHIGSGIRRIRDLCREWRVPAPAIDVSEHWVTVTFRRPALGGDGSIAAVREPGRYQVGTKLGPSRDQVAILRKSLSARPMTDLMAVMGRTNRTKFRNQVLRPLLDAGWIEMTVPDKPRSRNQRYRTTAAGKEVLAEGEGEDARGQA